MLKAKDIIVAMETPLARVRVSKISAGTIPSTMLVRLQKCVLAKRLTGERSIGCRETEVVRPCCYNEAPRCSLVVRLAWWKLGQQNRSDDEGKAIA